MASPTFIDLFCGAGLFSEGMRQAGFRPVFAVEKSEDAAASYRRNVSDNVVIGSVFDPRRAPKTDVLIAGPPCQGFSNLGTRNPLDERNSLGLSILPWTRRTRPKIVVIENVPLFLRSSQWAALREGLVTLGYGVDAWVLEAHEYGSPQRRRRAFTIASRIGPVGKPEPMPERATAGDAILNPRRPIASDDTMHTWPIHTGVAAERIAMVPFKGDRRHLLAAAPELCPASWSALGNNTTDVWARIDADKPANTVRCTFQNPSKGRYIHPTDNRVLSLREGARLQGVPDSWTFSGKPYPVAKQIGNGVPVHLALAVGRTIMKSM